jgi:hypothetical protein
MEDHNWLRMRKLGLDKLFLGEYSFLLGIHRNNENEGEMHIYNFGDCNNKCGG